MRQWFSRWDYLLLLAPIMVIATIRNHNVLSVGTLISFLLGKFIYTKYNKPHKRIWLVPVGIMFALVMGIIYYAVDAILFPHSQQAIHRLSEAYWLGPMLAVFGLILPAVSFAGRAKTMP